MKKIALIALFVSLMSAACLPAQVVIRVGPPPPVVERVPSPRAGYVWQNGYQSWNGRRYVWIPGRYVLAPYPHAVWVPGRYYRYRGGWRYRNGRWRR